MTNYEIVREAIIHPRLDDNQTCITALRALEEMRLDWLRSLFRWQDEPITCDAIDAAMKGGDASRAHNLGIRSDAPAAEIIHKVKLCHQCACSQTLPVDLQVCDCSCHLKDREQSTAGASADFPDFDPNREPEPELVEAAWKQAQDLMAKHNAASSHIAQAQCYQQKLNAAQHAVDLAREASNRDLEAKRAAELQLDNLRVFYAAEKWSAKETTEHQALEWHKEATRTAQYQDRALKAESDLATEKAAREKAEKELAEAVELLKPFAREKHYSVTPGVVTNAAKISDYDRAAAFVAAHERKEASHE